MYGVWRSFEGEGDTYFLLHEFLFTINMYIHIKNRWRQYEVVYLFLGVKGIGEWKSFLEGGNAINYENPYCIPTMFIYLSKEPP